MAILYTGSACTQRINGDRQDFQGLVIFENARGSNRLLSIKRLVTQLDNTGTSTGLLVPALTYRGAGAPNLEGAARANKGTFDTAKTSDPFINMWYAVTPDYAGESNMAGVSGILQWKQWASKLRTGAEQFNSMDNNQLPALVANKPYYLYPGEYLLVRVDPAALADNTVTNGWFCQAVWQEETLPVYTISGTVKLLGVGVVGAEVTITVADDHAMTNAYLHSVQVTGVGGAWSADIPVGKKAFASASNDVAGTLYQALNVPFMS